MDLTVLAFLGFVAFGMLVGVMAAERRKFSVGRGLLFGALLGVFSPLLFLVRERRGCSYGSSAPASHGEDEHVIRSMVVQIVVGTVVITSVVLLLLNLLVARP